MTRRRVVVAGREDGLKRLISDSKLLDRNLKRYWLGVLDHLTPASRARLEAILKGEAEDRDAGPGLGPSH